MMSQSKNLGQVLAKCPRFFYVSIVAVLFILALGGFALAFHIEACYIRETSAQAFRFLVTENVWRAFAIFMVLLNLKALPVVWHVRVFSAFVRHFQSSPQQLTPNWDSTTIFQPLITRTHAPLLEIDYFMHKSNSTYYSDLDVSRAHLLLALFQRGLARIKLADDGTHAGRLAIMLGAVHCSFRREIKPYQPYEIWSRVLCWDRKWLYIVTHFVEQGAVVPSGYTLQPPWYGKSNWFRSLLPLSRKRKEDGEAKTNSSRLNGKVDSVHPSVFATAISKCVLKKGRRTISPECLLVASGLLPPPPPECDDNAGLTAWTLAPECAGDWAAVEQERQRGMQFAQHFTQLDSLHGEFGAESRMALGAYGDLLP